MKSQNLAAQIKELKDSYAALPATLLESEAKVVEATKAGDLAGVQAASAELRKVADEFKGKLEAAYTSEPFGERIFIPDLLALQQFAKDNGRDQRVFYDRSMLENGRVVELDVSKTGIASLRALKALGGIRKLTCSINERLKTLEGVPTESLEKIEANWCGLKGDLSALSDAKGLKTVLVDFNKLLASLNGVPTEKLEVISASSCGLEGDLAALSDARKLKSAYLPLNKLLTSLNGVSTESLKDIHVRACGLKDDEAIKVLSFAEKLDYANLEENPFKSKTTPLITSLRKRIKDFKI